MYLIINPSDIYYLTGVKSYDPGEIFVIMNNETLPTGRQEGIMKNGGVILCDMRTSGLFDSQRYRIIDDRKKWGSELKKHKKLQVDPDFLTQSLRKKIEGYGIKLVMKKSPIVRERTYKKSHECELLRVSQTMNKSVYEMIIPFLIPGVSEEEIARKIQILQLELGASGPSFPPIVAFGEHSAVPHHSPTGRKLLPTDIILLDMGLVYGGYCSDMTRCLEIKKEEKCLNGISSRKKKKEGSFDEIYQLLQTVTNEIISYAKPGMKVSDLDKKARKMLGKYAKHFTHSLGHGVGIDIHEAPHISSKSDEILQPGMVITIEPGIYIPGKYGARYEEMVLVEKEKLEIL